MRGFIIPGFLVIAATLCLGTIAGHIDVALMQRVASVMIR